MMSFVNARPNAHSVDHCITSTLAATTRGLRRRHGRIVRRSRAYLALGHQAGL